MSVPAQPPAPYRFSVEQYHRMIDSGTLTANDRVELLEGTIVEMAAQGSGHVAGVKLTDKALDRALPPGWHVGTQNPVVLPTSEPEPDVAVLRGGIRDYSDRKPVPADVGLLVEVSDATLEFDRTRKASVYAAAGIPVYWIVNLIDRVLEVYRHPQSPAPGTASAYRTRQVYREEDAVPLELDGQVVAQVRVADLLP